MTDTYRPGAHTDRIHPDIADCFPASGAIAHYMWYATQRTHADPWLLLNAGLPMFFHHANTHGIRIGEIEKQRPSFWVMVIGSSACGKTTAQGIAEDFYATALERAPEDTISPFVRMEGSPEGILLELSARWHDDLEITPAIITRDEASDLLTRRDNLVLLINELWNQKTLTRHTIANQQRKKAGMNDQNTIRNPVLSAYFATTKSAFLANATEEHLSAGFLSRQNFCLAENLDLNKIKLYLDPCTEQRESALRGFEAMHTAWLANEAVGGPKIVQFGQDGHGALKKHALPFARKPGTSDEDPMLGFRLRGLSVIKTVAGIYALSEGRFFVSDDHVRRATNLVRRGSEQFEQILAPSVGVSTDVRRRIKAEQIIRKQGKTGVSRSHLYQALRCTKRELDDTLNTLSDAGTVRKVSRQPKNRGRGGTFYVSSDFFSN